MNKNPRDSHEERRFTSEKRNISWIGIPCLNAATAARSNDRGGNHPESVRPWQEFSICIGGLLSDSWINRQDAGEFFCIRELSSEVNIHVLTTEAAKEAQRARRYSSASRCLALKSIFAD